MAMTCDSLIWANLIFCFFNVAMVLACSFLHSRGLGNVNSWALRPQIADFVEEPATHWFRASFRYVINSNRVKN